MDTCYGIKGMKRLWLSLGIFSNYLKRMKKRNRLYNATIIKYKLTPVKIYENIDDFFKENPTNMDKKIERYKFLSEYYKTKASELEKYN